MKGETKKKMVVGAADLIRRRGVNATSVREIVRHTSTPRGSVSHHFPKGKQQMVEEAVIYSGQEVGEPLAALVSTHGSVKGLCAFISSWRKVLKETDYEAGCPVLAVAVEQYIGEDGLPDKAVQEHLLNLAEGIFSEWENTLAKALILEGVERKRAQRLASLIIASVEGTVAICRAEKSTRSLDDVETELKQLLKSVIKD